MKQLIINLINGTNNTSFCTWFQNTLESFGITYMLDLNNLSHERLLKLGKALVQDYVDQFSKDRMDHKMLYDNYIKPIQNYQL